MLRTLRRHKGRIDACAFSPDGARVVSASWDETLKLWDTETGRELRTLRGHTSWVVACAFSPDGVRVVSAGVDQALKLWDVETGREAAHPRGPHRYGLGLRRQPRWRAGSLGQRG